MIDVRSALLAVVAGLAILNAIPASPGQDEWEFRINRKPAVQAQRKVAAESDGTPPASGGVQDDDQKYYVVMYSATWCGPCQGWKRNELPKMRAAGVSVTVVDCDKEPQWNKARRATDSATGKTVVIPGVSAYPTFAVVRKSDRFPVATIVGPVPAAQLIARIPKPAAVPAVTPLSMRWNIEGDSTPTAEQTAAHMRDVHGISVEGMTHQQMLTMHDYLHDLDGK